MKQRTLGITLLTFFFALLIQQTGYSEDAAEQKNCRGLINQLRCAMNLEPIDKDATKNGSSSSESDGKSFGKSVATPPPKPPKEEGGEDGEDIAADAFSDGESLFTNQGRIDRSITTGGGEANTDFNAKDQAKTDQQLLDFKDGKSKDMSGGNIIVNSDFRQDTTLSRQEGSQGKASGGSEKVRAGLDIRQVGKDFTMQGSGKYIPGSGMGRSPSEALAGAIEESANSMRTDIKSDFTDKTTASRQIGDNKDWSVQQTTTSKIESTSFVPINDYKVTGVQEIKDKVDGSTWYKVDVKAQRGTVSKK